MFTFVTYPAEMRGGFAMVQVRVRDWTIYSLGSRVDCLVVFNRKAYARAAEGLRPGGLLIYDPQDLSPEAAAGVSLLPLPLTRLAAESGGAARGRNIVALGAQGHLLALQAGHRAAAAGGWPQRLHLSRLQPKGRHYMMLSGNEAVALGAIVAGCRFAAGYPITPSTSIFETLARLLPLAGGRALQMEDEIASVSAAIGASFGGEKAITATSGPGLQLMGEQLNLASMIEVPLVVVDVQRGGPSTGLPTKTEQSDLNLAVYGTSGDSPRIVLAPTSVEDSFYQTIRAFNLAERYQVPALLLTDQSIGYRRFQPTQDGVSPLARPGTPGGQYLATGLEHSETGLPDSSPENHLRMSRKRFRKKEVISRSFERNPIEMHGAPDAAIGIIGWGSTEGAIREARYLAGEKGIALRHLHPHTLSPMPERQITNFLMRLEHLIIVEENFTGQFAHYLKAKFGVKAIALRKCEGVPFTPEEILRGIEKVAGILDEYGIVGSRQV